MTLDELVKGFMRLSSTEKIHQPRSPVFNRIRAGRKGIGRFAAQRLGKRLTITTQTENMPQALQVTIDWERFAADTNLLAIGSKIETVPSRGSKGTTLIIDQLREAWSEAAIKRVYRFISELLQPFPLSDRLPKSSKQSSFEVSIYKTGPKGGRQIVADKYKAFFNHAVAIIEGTVDEDGFATWGLQGKKVDINYADEKLSSSDKEVNKPYQRLRNVRLKAYYFIFGVGYFPPNTQGSVQSKLREQGGIKIYRNGFRVLPYGEIGDDWAGLEKDTRTNVNLAPHANINFFGIVEIFDTEGEIFEETASREKLVENEAFTELSDFTLAVLVAATNRIASARGRKATTSSKNTEKKKPSDRIKDAAAALSGSNQQPPSEQGTSSETDNDKQEDEEETSRGGINSNPDPIKEILEANAEQEQENQRLLEENAQLRVLAGLGLVIGLFVHEVKTYVTNFNLNISSLNKLLIGQVDALRTLQNLTENVSTFSTYRSYFERMISDNIRRDLKPIELRDVVVPFVEAIHPDASNAGISLARPVFEGYNLFTVPTHRSEWASILFNLYSNAKKAIIRSSANGEMQIKCGKTKSMVFLEFSDNGDGIPVENRERVFDPFFTTSHPPGRLAELREELTGMGLGLKIVRDIVEGYNGTIRVIEPEPGFSTTLRIEIPSEKK